MIHVVFQQADVEALRKSFGIDQTMEGAIIEIKDDYAVGPIKDSYTEDGSAMRLAWWKEVLEGGHYNGLTEDGHVNDQQAVQQLKDMLSEKPDEVVWIWAAQNKHDVSGYYWLIGQLKEFQGRVHILYLNNLPFINEKGNIFYPVNLFQIPAKEFVKARKLARPVTLSEFEMDADEWVRLGKEEKGVRLLEGGKKLVQKDYTFYDKELLAFVNQDWTKVSKLFIQYYGKVKETTGDAFLLWRLKQMIESGIVEMQGNALNMKEFEVRMAVVEVEKAEMVQN